MDKKKYLLVNGVSSRGEYYSDSIEQLVALHRIDEKLGLTHHYHIINLQTGRQVQAKW